MLVGFKYYRLGILRKQNSYLLNNFGESVSHIVNQNALNPKNRYFHRRSPRSNQMRTVIGQKCQSHVTSQPIKQA